MRMGIVATCGCLAVFAVSSGWAEQSTYFRHDGGAASSDRALPDRFDQPGALVWRQPLKVGHSTPAISGDRIFLTSYDKDAQAVATIALDLETGSRLWERFAPTDEIEEFHQVGSPAAASIACDDDRVFVFFGSYGLLCYDRDGNLVWSQSLGPFQDEFGAASSPVLLGSTLYLNEDHDTDNYLYAFDARTGNRRWQVPRNEFTRSYATPIVFARAGKQEIVVAGALTLTGYDPKSGKRRWWMHGLARIVNPTPAVHDGVLYVATWSPGGDVGERITMESWDDARKQYDQNHDGKISRDELSPGAVLTRFFRIDINQDKGLDQSEWNKHAQIFERAENAIVAVRPRGEGELDESCVLWRYSKGIPFVASPLYHDGNVYLVKDGGILTVLDAQTGEARKRGRLRGRGNYYSSPIVADGKIYAASERGVVTIVSANADWQILSSHEFGESMYATPVVHDDRIFLRTDAALYCFTKPAD